MVLIFGFEAGVLEKMAIFGTGLILNPNNNLFKFISVINKFRLLKINYTVPKWSNQFFFNKNLYKFLNIIKSFN